MKLFPRHESIFGVMKIFWRHETTFSVMKLFPRHESTYGVMKIFRHHETTFSRHEIFFPVMNQYTASWNQLFSGQAITFRVLWKLVPPSSIRTCCQQSVAFSHQLFPASSALVSSSLALFFTVSLVSQNVSSFIYFSKPLVLMAKAWIMHLQENFKLHLTHFIYIFSLSYLNNIKSHSVFHNSVKVRFAAWLRKFTLEIVGWTSLRKRTCSQQVGTCLQQVQFTQTLKNLSDTYCWPHFVWLVNVEFY